MEKDNCIKRYRCQRCRNHKVEVARKGHVDSCPYRTCRCECCVLVERRTDTHRLLKQKALANKMTNYGTGGQKETMTMATVDKSIGTIRTKDKMRTLRCAKCSNHDVQAALKNHKQTCPYRNCPCTMCRLVDEYRSILKDQIKTRREQSRQRPDSTPPMSYDKSGMMTRIRPRLSLPLTQAEPPFQTRASVIVSSNTTSPTKPTWIGGEAADLSIFLSTFWQHPALFTGPLLPYVPAYMHIMNMDY